MLGAVDVAAHRHRRGGAGRADDRHDLVLLDQLARRGDGLGVVGGVVLDDELDRVAVDAAGVVDLLDLGLEHVLLGLAERRVRAGQGDDGADLDRLAARATVVALVLAAPGRHQGNDTASETASAAVSTAIESLSLLPRMIPASVCSVDALRRAQTRVSLC